MNNQIKTNKKTFWRRNKEKIKLFSSIGMSFAGIIIILIFIAFNMLNEIFAWLTLPFIIQSFITIIVKKAPDTIRELNAHITDVLKDENENDINEFLDDITNKHGSSSGRSVNILPSEPIELPIIREAEIEEPAEVMNAYFSKAKNQYIITPRIPV